MLDAPSSAHLLGTDNLGRDLMTRIQTAIQDAVLPTWAAILAAHVLGLFLGALQVSCDSTLIRRFFFSPIYLLALVVMSVPLGIVVFYSSVAFERASFSAFLMAVTVVMFFSTYIYLVNLYKVNEKLGFWTASKSLGASTRFQLVHHGIFRNWKDSLLRLLCFQLKVGVAAEAAVSYLGYATQEPSPSFGNIIASHFDLLLKGNFFVCIIVAAVMLFTSLVPRCIIALFLRNKSLGR